jgi:hypothetical protein
MQKINDEKKQISIIDQKSISNKNLNLQKLEFINDYKDLKKKIVFSELESITTSTHKNSADSCNFIKEKEAPFSTRLTVSELNNQRDLIYLNTDRSKKRKDYFGREIKKGGKHKISFADDLDIIKSLSPDINNNNTNNKDINKSLEIRKSLHNNLSKRKYLLLPIISTQKRPNSYNNSRFCLIKNIYNMSKIKTKLNNKFKESNVHVINIENLKKETKLNTFLINKNKTPIPEEENVCCSCYCSIW